MEENMKKKSNKTNKPVHSIRSGPVSASVFLNDGKNGEKFPSAIIRRSYKTESGYVASSSYSGRHIGQLAEVVADLQSWLATNYPDAGK